MSARCPCDGTDADCPRCGGTGEIPDGFRPRRTRPKGWLKAAIADGSVRDPNAPDPDAGKDYAGATVVSAPVATSEGG